MPASSLSHNEKKKSYTIHNNSIAILIVFFLEKILFFVNRRKRCKHPSRTNQKQLSEYKQIKPIANFGIETETIDISLFKVSFVKLSSLNKVSDLEFIDPKFNPYKIFKVIPRQR